MTTHRLRSLAAGFLIVGFLIPSLSSASTLTADQAKVFDLIASSLEAMQSVLTQIGTALNSLKAEIAANNTASSTGLIKTHILVAPKAGLSDEKLDSILKTHGGSRTGTIPDIDVHIVSLPANADPHAVAAILSHDPNIKFAEVDEVTDPAGTTNDPYLANEWHLFKIGAPAAWDKATGSGVTVAVVDGGVQSSHPDLSANMISGWNVYANTSDTSDVTGHGTAVAGVVAAIGNNGIGDAGIAYKAKIMPIRATDAAGNGTFSSAASGITWAADHGAKIVNVSWSNLYKSSTVISAANYLRSKGGMLVVSANNNGIDENYPADPSMIVVSNTDKNDAFYTGQYPSSYGNMVDVSAPGVDILTTLWNSQYNAPGYGAVGTSFSTAVVSGTLALEFSVNPSLSITQAESILESSAVDLGTSGWDKYYGWGRVNAGAAVALAASSTQTITTDTQAPTVSISSPSNGVTVSGNVPVSLTASDNVGVTKTELYVNNTLVSTDTTSPYGFSWNSTALPDGTADLVVKAYDAAGNIGTSQTVAVSVKNSVPADTIAPTVSITTPANGAQLGSKGTTKVSAKGSDNVGVTKMELYMDGKIMTTSTSGTISSSISNNKTSKGTHTVTAVAYDAAGNSASVAISVVK